MKKYKLLKDLPTWKAGEIFWIWEDENLYGMSEDWRVIMVYHFSTLINFDLLKNGEWFEEIKIQKSIFDLKIWDTYYYLDLNCSYSKVSYFTIFAEDDFLSYKSDLENWNIFLTEEEAEQELEKRQAIQRIKKYCFENDIELADRDFINNPENLKFTINFNTLTKKFIFILHSCISIDTSIFFFKKEEDVEKILENFEEDLKIIFNV